MSITAGWINMALGVEVGLDPPSKRGTAPSFQFMSIVAKRLDG